MRNDVSYCDGEDDSDETHGGSPFYALFLCAVILLVLIALGMAGWALKLRTP